MQNFFALHLTMSRAGIRQEKRAAATVFVVNGGLLLCVFDRKEILISSDVFESRARQPNSVRAEFLIAALLRLYAPMLREIAPRARGIHASLSGAMFFSLCCSKRNAVQVDSRPH